MKPDLDAIRARLWSASTRPYTFADDVSALLRYIDELEREIAELKARVEDVEE